MTRIGANLSAMRSIERLYLTNREIRQRLIRLASGKRINRVDEDPAGFSLARGLESRGRSLKQAADNVATARNVLAIAEGSYRAISDLLLTIVEKVVQGADDAYNVDQRAAIQGQIDAIVEEIDAIVEETNFNGTQLIDGSFVNRVFQTGPDAGDVLRVSLESAHSSAFAGFRNGFDVIAGVNDRLVFIEDGVTLTATMTPGSYTLTELATELEAALDTASVRPGVNYGVSFDEATGKYTISKTGGPPISILLKWTDSTSAGLAGLFGFSTSQDDEVNGPGNPTRVAVSDYAKSTVTLSVANATVAADTLDTVNTALNRINAIAQSVGEYAVRLDMKNDVLQATIANTEATRSRVEDTDYAKEMMGLIQLQILQQGGFAALSQANAAPQAVLGLIID